MAGAAGAVAGVSLWKLFWFFLKVGSVLYGSGYVLVAFLEGGLVEETGWLTQGQLLDAIAIGQFTPGPVLSTSTFVGYVVGAAGGVDPVAAAAVATLGIFLPSFLFVWVLNPLIPRLRESAWLSAFLDAVNAAAVALMAAVTVELAADTLVSWPAALIAALAAVAALRFKVSAVWLVVGGAALGWAAGAVGVIPSPGGVWEGEGAPRPSPSHTPTHPAPSSPVRRQINRTWYGTRSG